MSEEFNPDNRGQVILYRANGVNVPVEVTYWRRTFWMPQKNIARLFGVNVPAVSKHLANIYAEGELAESATMSEMEIVRNEGGRTVRRTIRFYSLDAIIAVGYRVSSPQATAFRQWATSVLHEYMIKGFALNDDMLKNGNTFGEDYFKELLARVREIRTSEKRLYQQVLAIFQEICTDYDKDSGIAREFYQNMQNRFHYAAHGHTAPEIITQRVDATKPHMGLTTCNQDDSGSRLPDAERSERISWPRPVVEHHPFCEICGYAQCTRPWVWRKNDKNKDRVKIYLPNQQYLVVLGERRDYWVLITAYYVNRQWSIDKLEKEYNSRFSTRIQ